MKKKDVKINKRVREINNIYTLYTHIVYTHSLTLAGKLTFKY